MILTKLTIGFGQNSSDIFRPNIVPPPPNTSNLGLYGQIPLNQFTGNPSVSIPLLEAKSNTIKVPISLSYSSDAIKVDQFESNTGMGWVLNAGGVVTRQVSDFQDNYNGRLQKPNTNLSSQEMITFLDQATNAPQVDTQPDIFSYNVNGLSGKFFLDNNNIPVEIEPSGLKIEITSDFLSIGYAPNNLPEIIITDTKGIKYYFGGLNAIESSSTRQIFFGSSGNPPSEDIKTSWYLTKIEDSNSNNQITFTYDSKNSIYYSGIDQNLSYTYSGSQRLSSNLKTLQYKSTSQESVLKEINSNNSKITFIYSNRFDDPDFTLLKLDEVIETSKNSVLIKKIRLDYTQYVASSFSNTYNQTPNYLKKRFFLNQIKEYSNTTTPITHKFEYYSPELLPIRFSFAQDNYGVFNAKSNSSLISDELVIPNSVIYSVFNDQKLANRRPNKNVGYYGLLKKITYPTKGETTIEYEPHIKGKVNIPVYPSKNHFSLNVQTDDELFTNTSTLTLHSSTEQTIKINGFIQNNCQGENPFPLISNVEIINTSTNQPVNFISISQADEPQVLGATYTISANPSLTNVVFDLEANKDYLVKIKLTRPCMYSNVYFDYYHNPVSFEEIDNEIGGYRVSRILKSNLNNTIIEKEKYFYGPFNCLNCQTGSYVNKAPIAFISKVERNNLCESPASRIISSVGSSNLSRIYSAQNVQFGYEFVCKSYGDNFENGGEETRYLIVQDELAIPLIGLNYNLTPSSNGFNSGKIISNTIFTKKGVNNFISSKSITNEYFHDSAKDKEIKGYKTYQSKQQFSYVASANNPPTCPQTFLSDDFTLNEYSLKSQWYYLKKTTEKSYDINGQNPIEVTTNYSYNNSNHLQLNSQITTSSTGQTLETKYSYAHEMGNQAMIAKNMIGIPLKTETLRNNEKLSTQETLYKDWGNNLLAPEIVKVSKGNQNLEDRIKYNRMDNTTGNPLEVEQIGGIKIAYIWGYNKTQPIAKIENASYADVESYVSNLQSKSDTGTESELITALNNLRTALPNAMVTTLTYKPLVGISTVTDPKGNRTTYLYDEFNRLKQVVDHQGNVISENNYNYRSNQN